MTQTNRAFLADAGTGHRAGAKGVFHPIGMEAALGAELRLLRQPSNGYFLSRLFASRTWRVLSATADLYGYFFEERVNDEKASLGVTLTGGWEFARGWQVLLSGNAGATPYLARELGVMAKLSYNQTYVVREVRR